MIWDVIPLPARVVCVVLGHAWEAVPHEGTKAGDNFVDVVCSRCDDVTLFAVDVRALDP